MPLPSTLRAFTLAGLAPGLLFALPAAAGEIATRVVGCAEGNCLLITGRRADVASAVSINGRAVAVEGARKWRVRIPVETLRGWSAPLARTITVSVEDNGNRAESEARLPIGLLGQAEDLAFLVVSMK